MENKKLLGALGILGVIVVAVIVAAGLFFNNKATPSIKPQPAGPRVIAQVPAEGERLDLSAPNSNSIRQRHGCGQNWRLVLDFCQRGNCLWSTDLGRRPNLDLHPQLATRAWHGLHGDHHRSHIQRWHPCGGHHQAGIQDIGDSRRGAGIPRRRHARSGFEHQHHGHLQSSRCAC